MELVDGALHIIATEGITALGTRRLAAEVGLTTGAIFRHFASLEALLEAVVARVEAVLEASYPPPSLPPLERLERFMEVRSTAVGDQLGILRLVVSEQFSLALPEHGRQRLAACVRKSRAFVVGSLRDAQSTGEVRADVDAEVLAPIVMGTMQLLAVGRASTTHRVADPRRVRDGLLTLLRPAAVTRRARKRPTP